MYHGMTFTSKIKFKDVIISIANFAFVASAYPVVLSLEMHCSLPQQAAALPSYHPMPRPRDAMRTYSLILTNLLTNLAGEDRQLPKRAPPREAPPPLGRRAALPTLLWRGHQGATLAAAAHVQGTPYTSYGYAYYGSSCTRYTCYSYAYSYHGSTCYRCSSRGAP